MKDFEKIRSICQSNSKISEKLIDEFLLYYAAKRNNLEHKMDKEFATYKHLNVKLKTELINRLKSQYIIHKVFKKDGLIRSLLNHPVLKALDKEDYDFLDFHAQHPWRFSFSTIIDNPADGFFVMEDVFTEEEFLLYSPGVKKSLEERSVILWFNLISFNGACWQSFGPIGAFNSFEPDDIFFFATEVERDIAEEEELLEHLENNPLPYMMLLSGSNTPLIFNREYQMVHVLSEYESVSLNTKDMTKSFISEYNKGIYRLSLKKWGEYPHFSQAYFDENRNTLTLSSMTDMGFIALVEGLNKYGNKFPYDPFLRVNPSMVLTASEILKRKIRLTEYEELFSKDTPPSDKENIDKMNAFMKLVVPEINAGREPDIEAHAHKAGIDISTAITLVKQINASVNKLNKGTRNN